MMTQTQPDGKQGSCVIVIQILDRRLSGETFWRDYYEVTTHSYRHKLQKFRRNNPTLQCRAAIAETVDDAEYRDPITLAAMPDES